MIASAFDQPQESAPVIGVLALQGGVDEHLVALEQAGATPVSVRTEQDLDSVEALVIPGGESTTISHLAIRFGMFAPIQQRIQAGMPTFGSCAGMIMLANEVLDGRTDRPSFGGLDVSVRRNAFGRQVDSFECDLNFSGLGGAPFPAVFIRAPWVERVGPGVEVLASIEDESGAGRIVAVRQGSLIAASFHPELTGDARIHRLFVDIVKGQA
ncbi:MAG: pyridoxal 5'-phosphate synthase glutaminase subunit PdxT [Candidatus Nanopelagicales bacterium]